MSSLPLPLLTHSRIACAKQCFRKHYLRYELGIRRLRESTPLRMGSAVHAGLDVLGTSRDIAAAVTAAVAGYESIPAWVAVDGEIYADWLVERETVASMVASYATRWNWIGFEVVESEVEFRVPIVNPRSGAKMRSFELGGKIDKIIRLQDGRLALMEHKTTGDDISPESDYWRKMRIDQQIGIYVLAARSLGHDVSTVVYDVLRKPSIRPKAIDAASKKAIEATGLYFDRPADCGIPAQRETAFMYGSRLLSDIASRVDFYFARTVVHHSSFGIDDCRADLWEFAQMLLHSRSRGYWPRNSGACLSPYRCEFLDLCENGIASADALPDGFGVVENVHSELREVV